MADHHMPLPMPPYETTVGYAPGSQNLPQALISCGPMAFTAYLSSSRELVLRVKSPCCRGELTNGESFLLCGSCGAEAWRRPFMPFHSISSKSLENGMSRLWLHSYLTHLTPDGLTREFIIMDLLEKLSLLREKLAQEKTFSYSTLHRIFVREEV